MNAAPDIGFPGLSKARAPADSFSYLRGLRVKACVLTKERGAADLLVERVLKRAISEADDLSDSASLEAWLDQLLRSEWTGNG